MPPKVDRAIREVESKGHDKGSAIAILKASGAIKQKGAHLDVGPSLHAGKKHGLPPHMSRACDKKGKK